MVLPSSLILWQLMQPRLVNSSLPAVVSGGGVGVAGVEVDVDMGVAVGVAVDVVPPQAEIITTRERASPGISQVFLM